MLRLRWSDGTSRAHEFDAGESREAIAFAVGASLPLAFLSVGPCLHLHIWDTFGTVPQWIAVVSTRGFPLTVNPRAEWSREHDEQVAERVLAVMDHSVRLAGLTDNVGHLVSDGQ